VTSRRSSNPFFTKCRIRIEKILDKNPQMIPTTIANPLGTNPDDAVIPANPATNPFDRACITFEKKFCLASSLKSSESSYSFL